jgi:hypothetical protein
MKEREGERKKWQFIFRNKHLLRNVKKNPVKKKRDVATQT